MPPPNRKRQRTDEYSFNEDRSFAADVRSHRSAFLTSLGRDISPPSSRHPPALPNKVEPEGRLGETTTTRGTTTSSITAPTSITAVMPKPRVIPSPFKLTRIRDLPANANLDTVGIQDILGDVMLKEIWLFDYLFDVDWIMQQLDPDTKDLVSVVLVHGSWRREDSNKIRIDQTSKRYSNVKVVTAHMPEMYGCHHSKCMVLFRHDDLAQVIVHTANMIEQDWRNLTQGAWLSPLLPVQRHTSPRVPSTIPSIGTGARFKHDFMAYCRHYGHRTKLLVSELERYDFTAIRAALIAHVPAKFDGKETDQAAQLWGWPALKRALQSVPSTSNPNTRQKAEDACHIICQVSSIASLSEKWIHGTLFSTLRTTSSSSSASSMKPKSMTASQLESTISIVFPTPGEIRTCLDGYVAGGSIHCKLQNASQRKQFELMKPHLRHWNAPTTAPHAHHTRGLSPTANIAHGRVVVGTALRGPAAPHIKTFTRLRADGSVDWALLTSANLSTQAWGTAAHDTSGEVRISSYELGVLVWPDLFLQDDHGEGISDGQEARKMEDDRVQRAGAKMIPTFGADTPSDAQILHTAGVLSKTEEGGEKNKNGNEDDEDTSRPLTIVGLRMPYDLPLTPYGANDEVWSARGSYAEPDVFGRAWNI